MPTVIFPAPIYGPVHSRRMGISLGINLMPHDGKVCTFDCVYCECGFNKDRIAHSKRPTRQEVQRALELRLEQMHMEGEVPDVLTFAGNGEPTTHPDFLGIIEDTIALRNRFCPKAKVSVLSNASFAARPNIRKALMLVDNNILKLDTINLEYIQLVDRPLYPYDVEKVVEALKAFNGHVIVQTMFMKGTVDGKNVDNTGDEYVLPWLEAVKEIKPQQVMIYTIDRETPNHDLQKATHEELDRIVAMIEKEGFPATASY